MGRAWLGSHIWGRQTRRLGAEVPPLRTGGPLAEGGQELPPTGTRPHTGAHTLHPSCFLSLLPQPLCCKGLQTFLEVARTYMRLLKRICIPRQHIHGDTHAGSAQSYTYNPHTGTRTHAHTHTPLQGWSPAGPGVSQPLEGRGLLMLFLSAFGPQRAPRHQS